LRRSAARLDDSERFGFKPVGSSAQIGAAGVADNG
jgi:hypothetical protein